MNRKMYGIIATYTDSEMANYAEYKPVTKEVLMECDGNGLYDLELAKSQVEKIKRREIFESVRIVEIREIEQ